MRNDRSTRPVLVGGMFFRFWMGPFPAFHGLSVRCTTAPPENRGVE